MNLVYSQNNNKKILQKKSSLKDEYKKENIAWTDFYTDNTFFYLDD
ncbi:MAG: hypothetical protein BAJALOKI3v1_280001, partial [Promethearchaeota archaeon]